MTDKLEEKQLTSHCPTCECFNTNSVTMLSQRISRITSYLNALAFKTFSDTAKEMLGGPASHIKFACGFTGLKADQGSTRLAGQFLAAVGSRREPRPRFFVVQLLSPMALGHFLHDRDAPHPQAEVKALEYAPGDDFEFDPQTTLHGHDIDAIAEQSDSELVPWIREHLEPLWRRVEEVAPEQKAAEEAWLAANPEEERDDDA